MDVRVFSRTFGRELRAGSAAVLCGAGVSIPSGLPSWRELLSDARVELGLPDTFEDLSLLATYYVANIDGGRAKLTKMILSRIQRDDHEPNETHHAIWQLPIRYVWSLNFDDLLERALSPAARVIASDNEMRGSLTGAGRAVVKLHGGISDLAGSRPIVISRDDFDEYTHTFSRTWARLLADFHTKSLLFVGISFADPNMQTLLRLVRTARRPITQQHYALIERAESATTPQARALRSLQALDLKRGGVEPVELSSFEEVPRHVKKLAVAARQPNVLISGSIERDDRFALTFLEALGILLASTNRPVNLVHGGGTASDPCAESFSRHIERIGVYAAERVLLMRRSGVQRSEPTISASRHGIVRFPGPDTSDVRRLLCTEASVCIAIGGSDRCAEELAECDRQGVLVIPTPFARGVAEQRWNIDASSNDAPRYVISRLKKLALPSSEEPMAMAQIVAQLIHEHLFGDH